MTGEPVEEPSATEPFSAVADLGPHGETAAARLRAVHEELLSLGAGDDAERLVVANRAAALRDFPMLERLVVREHRLDQLEDLQHHQVRRITSLRNATALLPLVITWLLLGWASLLYQRQLTADPELAAQPFLSLWQTRFGGGLILTFTETALTTVVLILAILGLTVWAHRAETTSSRVLADLAGRLDDAMDALAAAAADNVVQPPVTAQEWARTAQEILTKTQEALSTTQATINAAVAETKGLAETNRKLSEDAHKEMAQLQQRAHEKMARLQEQAQQDMAELQKQAETLVGGLAREVRDTLGAVREDNTQFISRTTQEALLVLRQAVADNRQLVEQQMTPLFDGFRESLQDYRADHQVYRAAATEMATEVTGLSESASVIAAASSSHAEAAKSIDRQLEHIEQSQTNMVATVAEHSTTIKSAATGLSEVTALLTGRMRGDLETMTNDVVLASKRIADVDAGLSVTTAELAKTIGALASTTSTLATTAGALQGAATQLAKAAAASPARRTWPWPFRRGGGA
ncbi:hypothetical protein [Saccharothrix luteola]|uniref:hypothetical protein n=1 Tax=Saccharothrix luteola TaxID=2893018 RepID=UPI001E2AE346|nr:hypothetical protein [Saccharothrix luteola]MCC8245551.1 hypothetical protein [Saccharothrix luteola]